MQAIRSHGNEHSISSEGLDCVRVVGNAFLKGKKNQGNSFVPSQQGELAHQGIHQRVLGQETEKSVWSRAVAERSLAGAG